MLANKDFLAGLMYMAFGLTGLWLGRSLEVGTAAAMGAGYFPRLVCGALIAVGAALALISLMRIGEVPERGRWRPFIFALRSRSCCGRSGSFWRLRSAPCLRVSLDAISGRFRSCCFASF